MDLGTVRSGIAVSDRSEFLASPVGTITERDLSVLADKVAVAVQEQGAEEIVVGHPRNMDGSCGASALRAEEFAEILRQKLTVPVHLWDERMTTLSAIGYLNESDIRGKKRKAVVDTVAATIILQNYLDSRKLEKS